MMGTTEWIMTNRDINYKEYPKLAKTFYPSEFDADAWVKAIKAAGAKYITITTRHHDGFSLFKTATSPYNSVDGTPFKRDIIKKWLMHANEMVSSCIFTILTLTGDAKTIQWEEQELALVDQKRRLTGQATISL